MMPIWMMNRMRYEIQYKQQHCYDDLMMIQYCTKKVGKRYGTWDGTKRFVKWFLMNTTSMILNKMHTITTKTIITQIILVVEAVMYLALSTITKATIIVQPVVLNPKNARKDSTEQQHRPLYQI